MGRDFLGNRESCTAVVSRRRRVPCQGKRQKTLQCLAIKHLDRSYAIDAGVPYTGLRQRSESPKLGSTVNVATTFKESISPVSSLRFNGLEQNALRLSGRRGKSSVPDLCLCTAPIVCLPTATQD